MDKTLEQKIINDTENMSNRDLSMIINSQKYSEDHDAGLITAAALIYSILAHYFLDKGLSHIIFSSALTSAAITIIFIVLIYIVKINFFKSNNAYIKRKFFSIGLLFMTYCLSIPLLLSNKNIISVIISFTPLIYHKTIINTIWYRFDRRVYKDIDKDNVFQKRSIFEKEIDAYLSYYSNIEFEKREKEYIKTNATKRKTIRNLDDIDIRNRG